MYEKNYIAVIQRVMGILKRIYLSNTVNISRDLYKKPSKPL